MRYAYQGIIEKISDSGYKKILLINNRKFLVSEAIIEHTSAFPLRKGQEVLLYIEYWEVGETYKNIWGDIKVCSTEQHEVLDFCPGNYELELQKLEDSKVPNEQLAHYYKCDGTTLEQHVRNIDREIEALLRLKKVVNHREHRDLTEIIKAYYIRREREYKEQQRWRDDSENKRESEQMNYCREHGISY